MRKVFNTFLLWRIKHLNDRSFLLVLSVIVGVLAGLIAWALKSGVFYMKRCNIPALIRDKEYDITQGTEGSKIMYFSANPNGEAELLKVYLRPKPRLKKTVIDRAEDYVILTKGLMTLKIEQGQKELELYAVNV